MPNNFKISSLFLFIFLTSGLMAQKKELLYQTGSIYAKNQEENILPIKVMSKEEIRMLNASNVLDVLSYIMNFETTYVGKRGFDLRFNGWGKNNIKLLINGKPVVPDALDKFSYTQIPTYNIERIEIIEGSYPVLYASNAVSVVVNIILQSNTKDLINVQAGARINDKQNTDVYGILELNSTKHRLGIGVNRNFFGGYDQNASLRQKQWKPYRQWNITADYNYKIIHGLQFYSTIYSTDELVRDFGNPVTNTNRVVDHELNTRHTILTGGLKGRLSKYHYLLFDNSYTAYKQQNTAFTRLINQDLERGSSSAPGDSISYDQYKVMFILARVMRDKFGYEMGMEFNHQRDRNLLIQDAIKTKITNMAFNGRISVQPNPLFSFNAGLRVNRSSKYSTPLSYEGNFKYSLTDEFSIKGNYSKSFRTPTFNELFYIYEDESLNIKGNLNLESEIYEGFIGSMNLESGNMTIFFSAYFQKTNNGIVLDVIDEENQVYSFVNVQKVKTQGSKLSAIYTSDPLKFSFGANLITFPSEEGGINSSFQELTFRANYTHKKSGFQIWTFNKFRTKKDEDVLADNDSLEILKIFPYLLSDFGMSLPVLNKKVIVSIGVKNIWDVNNVTGLHLPLLRLNDEEIDKKIPVAIDYGRKYWLSLVYNL